MNTTDQAIEQEIQAKGLTAPRVTPTDVESAISSEHYFTASDGMWDKGLEEYRPNAPAAFDLITICIMILRNGHRIVGINEGPVSPENFDADLGRNLARQKAVDQIWPLLGYELNERLFQAQQPSRMPDSQ